MDRLIQNLEPRMIMLIMGATVLLTVAALFSYVVWPGVKDYRESNRSVTALSNSIASDASLDAELARLRGDLELLERRLHGDTINLPENQLESFIVGRLQNISWRNNMQLLGVKPGKGNRVHRFEELLFDVEVSGDYFDLYDWLQDLSEELGFVVVKHFKLRPLDQKEASPRLRAILTIVSYREGSDA